MNPERPVATVVPRLGVIAQWPIQYHAPLYRRLAARGKVEVDVLFLSDIGCRPFLDPEFGTTVAWDIDLVHGYRHSFLTTFDARPRFTAKLGRLQRWIRSHDAIVVNGYSRPWMLAAMALCRVNGIPFLFRGSSHPEGMSTGFRRHLRRVLAHAVVTSSAAGLCMGKRNEEFYHQHGARSITFAPNSVDDEWFARPPEIKRQEVLRRWGLDDWRPVVMFSGKLIPRKRPLDLAAAVRLLPYKVSTLFVGDGILADQVRSSVPAGDGAVTGFINQSELSSYYHTADVIVLPSEVETWGLVINEGMAAGAVPVVSDRVGCAPDLAAGVGEVYPCADVRELAAALTRALARAADLGTRDRVRGHAARYSLERTAAGFEEAVIQVCGSHQRRASSVPVQTSGGLRLSDNASGIRVGVVGVGYWGSKHVRVLRSTAGVSGVVGIDQRFTTADHGPEQVDRDVVEYADMTDALADIDAVVIATPPSSHARLGMAAISAGKHVFIEKPMAMTTAEGRALIDAADSAGVVLMSGHTFEHSPAVHALRDLIRGGELGRLFRLDCARLNLGLYQSDVNVIADLASHDISIANFLLGTRPTILTAWGARHVHPRHEDVAYLRLDYAEAGVQVNVHVSWLHPAKVRQVTAIGSDKMAIYDDLLNEQQIKIYDKAAIPPGNGGGPLSRVAYHLGGMVAPFIPFAEPLSIQDQHFVDCIREGRKPATDGSSGLNVVQALECARISLAQDRPVALAELGEPGSLAREVLSASPSHYVVHGVDR